MQMSKQAFPQLINLVKRFPDVKVILDHLARPVLEDGPPYAAAAGLFELARFPTIYLKVTPRTFTECRNGKATPETFFPKLVGEFGASRIAWGSNYPASQGPLKNLLGGGAGLGCVLAAVRSGPDFRQHGAIALSGIAR